MILSIFSLFLKSICDLVCTTRVIVLLDGLFQIVLSRKEFIRLFRSPKRPSSAFSVPWSISALEKVCYFNLLTHYWKDDFAAQTSMSLFFCWIFSSSDCLVCCDTVSYQEEHSLIAKPHLNAHSAFHALVFQTQYLMFPVMISLMC